MKDVLFASLLAGSMFAAGAASAHSNAPMTSKELLAQQRHGVTNNQRPERSPERAREESFHFKHAEGNSNR